jgi:hypothetical protein
MTRVPSKTLRLIVLLAFLMFTGFYAETFVLTHISHEHDHDGADGGCALCSEIETAVMLLEGFGRVAGVILAAAAIAYIKKFTLKPAVIYDTPLTPVALKIRINS